MASVYTMQQEVKTSKKLILNKKAILSNIHKYKRVSKDQESIILTFTIRFNQLIFDSGMKSIDIINKLGIASSGYTNYRTGRRLPEPFILIKIAKLFNCSLDYLVGMSDNLNKEEI